MEFYLQFFIRTSGVLLAISFGRFLGSEGPTTSVTIVLGMLIFALINYRKVPLLHGRTSPESIDWGSPLSFSQLPMSEWNKSRSDPSILEDRTADHVELSLPSFYTVRAPYPFSNRRKAGETTFFISDSPYAFCCSTMLSPKQNSSGWKKGTGLIPQ